MVNENTILGTEEAPETDLEEHRRQVLFSLQRQFDRMSSGPPSPVVAEPQTAFTENAPESLRGN